jgi:hypothetical protein
MEEGNSISSDIKNRRGEVVPIFWKNWYYAGNLINEAAL